jgi:hypothetical protein
MWREERKELEKTWGQGFNQTNQEAKARDSMTILGLASRSGEVVTSRTFHRLSFGIVGPCLDCNGRCVRGACYMGFG